MRIDAECRQSLPAKLSSGNGSARRRYWEPSAM